MCISETYSHVSEFQKLKEKQDSLKYVSDTYRKRNHIPYESDTPLRSIRASYAAFNATEYNIYDI